MPTFSSPLHEPIRRGCRCHSMTGAHHPPVWHYHNGPSHCGSETGVTNARVKEINHAGSPAPYRPTGVIRGCDGQSELATTIPLGGGCGTE
jgi:hypothetical protein